MQMLDTINNAPEARSLVKTPLITALDSLPQVLPSIA
jgi:hypothetical protein